MSKCFSAYKIVIYFQQLYLIFASYSLRLFGEHNPPDSPKEQMASCFLGPHWGRRTSLAICCSQSASPIETGVPHMCPSCEQHKSTACKCQGDLIVSGLAKKKKQSLRYFVINAVCTYSSLIRFQGGM